MATPDYATFIHNESVDSNPCSHFDKDQPMADGLSSIDDGRHNGPMFYL